MSKTGGAVTKLQDKAKRNAMHFRMGRHRPVIVRTKTQFADKQVALLEHKRAIHGLVVIHGDREIVLDHGGRNPGPAECFAGDGLPDDSLGALKAPKSNQERAEADKRNSIKSEVCEGWRPRPFGKRSRSGSYLRR